MIKFYSKVVKFELYNRTKIENCENMVSLKISIYLIDRVRTFVRQNFFSLKNQ